MSVARISVRGVGKRFHAFATVEGMELHIFGGEFPTILGPSGSGKMPFAGLRRRPKGACS
jgi:ABC-type Fe3+/spermidine/putrescine transport system ATPase subunit